MSAKLPKNSSGFSSLDPALKRGGRLKFEKRITLLALAAGFPAVFLVGFLLWYDSYSMRLQWTVDLLLVLLWLGIASNLKQRIVRPLQTLSNILAAIREGDYSIRGRRAATGDVLEPRRRRRTAHHANGFSRWRRSLGHPAQHLSRRRCATSVARANRSKSDAARRRENSMAASVARTRPRIE